VLGDMNVALEQEDMTEGPGFYQTGGDPPIGDKVTGDTTANERFAWKTVVRKGLVGPIR